MFVKSTRFKQVCQLLLSIIVALTRDILRCNFLSCFYLISLMTDFLLLYFISSNYYFY